MDASLLFALCCPTGKRTNQRSAGPVSRDTAGGIRRARYYREHLALCPAQTVEELPARLAHELSLIAVARGLQQYYTGQQIPRLRRECASSSVVFRFSVLR